MDIANGKRHFAQTEAFNTPTLSKANDRSQYSICHQLYRNTQVHRQASLSVQLRKHEHGVNELQSFKHTSKYTTSTWNTLSGGLYERYREWPRQPSVRWTKTQLTWMVMIAKCKLSLMEADTMTWRTAVDDDCRQTPRNQAELEKKRRFTGPHWTTSQPGKINMQPVRTSQYTLNSVLSLP